jgi:YVTN family beta-propeller protein
MMQSSSVGTRFIVRFVILLGLLPAGLQVSAQTLDGFITIAQGNATFHVGVNPVTNRIYTSSEGFGPIVDDGFVNVIDGATNRIVATVAVPPGAEDIVANPMTNRIYVGSFRSQTVTVIDGLDNTVMETVSVPDHPFSIAVNPVTNRIYSRGEQSVSVLDGVTNDVIATIPIVGGPIGLAVDFARNRVFVVDASAGIVVVDGATNAVIDAVPLPGGQLRGLEADPVGGRLYVADGPNVLVLDTTTLATIASVPVDGFPTALALNTSTNRLYVRTELSGVAVIDTLNNSVVKTFAVTDTSSNIDIGVNPVTNAVYVPMATDELVWVTQDPSPIGGRDFGIRVVANGVHLSWTAGTKESKYSIVRWAGDGGNTVETIANLPKGTTSFVDQESLTESAYHYALLPLDEASVPLWISDIVGLSPNIQSNQHAPTNFTLRHAAHAYNRGQFGSGVSMSWKAPGNQDGYVLASAGLVSCLSSPLSPEATSASQLIVEPTYFMLFAGVGEEAGFTHILSAIPLTWAMNNDPSLAGQIASISTPGKLKKPAKPAKPTTATKRRNVKSVSKPKSK